MIVVITIKKAGKIITISIACAANTIAIALVTFCSSSSSTSRAWSVVSRAPELAIDSAIMVDDELWGSDNDQELDQEWQARQTQFHTLGYRDGVEAGKNASVQEGFNVGYAESTVAGFNLGLARGLTAAFAALPGAARESLVSGGEARARLEALEASIRRYSSADAQRSFYLTEVSGEDTSMAGVDRVPQTSSVGVWAAQGVSGRRELEEMARSVRSELEAASVNISDVLVAV